MKRLLTILSLSVVFCISTLAQTNLMEYPVWKKPVKEIVASRKGFTLSYNPDYKIPNWVAYEITCEETKGTVPRCKYFVPDPDMGRHSADNDDYRLSGWDRGHMAPAGDMKWDSTAMAESFYYSNVCPQNHDLNGGEWHKLENKVRAWACKFDRLWVVTGPIIGVNPSTIGPHKVVVPAAFFKAVLYYHNGTYEAVGFMMPNRNDECPLWDFALSIDDLELLTGLDFFSVLPDAIENQIESEYHPKRW